MTGSAHTSFGLGGIIYLGGAYAYFIKGSRPSFVASAVLGTLLVTGGYLIKTGNEFMGHSLSFAASGSIASFGLYRWTSTMKPFPSLPLLFLGTVSALYQGKKALEWI